MNFIGTSRKTYILMFDVIDMDSGISEELKKEIERDGVVIYEKA